MRAKTAYRLIHTRGSRAPAFLASADSVDHVEIVEDASMEVILFWDVPGPEARRFVGALRNDLAALDADAFVARWREVRSAANLP
jgi:hypothetical protein